MGVWEWNVKNWEMNKTMIKMLVFTEIFFFMSLIMAYVYMVYYGDTRSANELQSLHISTTGIFTLVLISSSFTFYIAERNFLKGNIRQLKIWLVITLILGFIFLYGQGSEYYRLINEQITLGASVFGTNFFTLTGFHGFHVFVGLILISVLITMAVLGDFGDSNSTVIQTVGIYWHFVDAVWIVVFTVVYVLPKFMEIKT
jgi:heme/copper-type cytochrome/quinol oxidase subunit 3